MTQNGEKSEKSFRNVLPVRKKSLPLQSVSTRKKRNTIFEHIEQQKCSIRKGT